MFTESKLIKHLQNQKLFPHNVKGFDLKETHLSWVILTGDFAYKIKKPVNLDFVDFSTLSKRKHFCELELKLNKRLTTDVYLEVLPIYGTDQEPSFENNGPVIEYVIKMQQFQQHDLFDRLQEDKLLSSNHIKNIALQISNFHKHAITIDQKSVLGGYNIVKQSSMANFGAIAGFDVDKKTKESLDELAEWTKESLNQHKDFFNNRKKFGYVKHCHGDMHLGNIALLQDIPIIFDCIDFNEEFYWIDVINEVAFLAMDLMMRGENEHANFLLNSYLEKTNDYEGIRLLKFYLIYRTLVRGKVALLTSPKVQYNIFKQYTNLAVSICKIKAEFLAITFGLSGSGKSTISQKVARKYNAIILRSDVERYHFCGENKAYTQDVNDTIYNNLKDKAKLIINSGFSVIIDATFLKKHHRSVFLKLAKELEVQFHILHTHVEVNTLQKRVMNRSNDYSEANAGVIKMQLSDAEPLSEEEILFHTEIDTSTNNVVIDL